MAESHNDGIMVNFKKNHSSSGLNKLNVCYTVMSF